MIYYSLIHPYLTYCVNVWPSTYLTNLKTLCKAQNTSVSTLFTTTQQPHSRDIFMNQKLLPLDKLINHQEGILFYCYFILFTCDLLTGNKWHIPAERLSQSWRC